MRTFKRAIAVSFVAALASLGGPSFGAGTTLAAKPLNRHAIHAALAQNTLRVATTKGKATRVYLGAHDVMRGLVDGKRVKGHWSISGNMLCLSFAKSRQSGCWSVLRHRDGTLQLYDKTGTPAGYLHVTKGNPHHF